MVSKAKKNFINLIWNGNEEEKETHAQHCYGGWNVFQNNDVIPFDRESQRSKALFDFKQWFHLAFWFIGIATKLYVICYIVAINKIMLMSTSEWNRDRLHVLFVLLFCGDMFGSSINMHFISTIINKTCNKRLTKTNNTPLIS